MKPWVVGRLFFGFQPKLWFFPAPSVNDSRFLKEKHEPERPKLKENVAYVVLSMFTGQPQTKQITSNPAVVGLL